MSAVILALVLGAFVVSGFVESMREHDRRDRLAVVARELETALAGYVGCALPPSRDDGPWPYDAWVRGEEIDRACAPALQVAIDAARVRIGDDDDDAAALPAVYPAGDVDGACTLIGELGRAIDELRRRARLAPAEVVACAMPRSPLDPSFVDRADYAKLFDAVTLSEPWVRSEDGALYIGGRFERLVVGKLTGADVSARHAEGTWTRAELAGDVVRMRWQDGGPWAIVRYDPKTAFRVALHRGGVWSERVELPRITDVEAMRSTGGGRVLVARRSDDTLQVIRLDAEAQTILETVDLVKTPRVPTLIVTPAGDVTAIWELEDGDADVIFLAAGAKAPRRTIEKATGAAFDQCLDDRDVFLRFGARLLHSPDGGATLTEIPGFDSLEWHHLACGRGWLAGLETDGDTYVVCRPGGCTRVPFTTRDYQRLALSAEGDVVRILAQSREASALWDDPGPAGAPVLGGIWHLDVGHTLVQLDGTWFHTAAADRGAY